MFQLLEATSPTPSQGLDGLISGLDFSILENNYVKVVAVAIPVAVGILALKKGVSWLMRTIKNA